MTKQELPEMISFNQAAEIIANEVKVYPQTVHNAILKSGAREVFKVSEIPANGKKAAIDLMLSIELDNLKKHIMDNSQCMVTDRLLIITLAKKLQGSHPDSKLAAKALKYMGL